MGYSNYCHKSGHCASSGQVSNVLALHCRGCRVLKISQSSIGTVEVNRKIHTLEFHKCSQHSWEGFIRPQSAWGW